MLDSTSRPCQQTWLTDSGGWIASPASTGCLSANCFDCHSFVCIPTGPVQLRFQITSWKLNYDDYIEIRDGKTTDDGLIRRLSGRGMPHSPYQSTDRCIYVNFHATSSGYSDIGFNATFQQRGEKEYDEKMNLLQLNIVECLLM